MDRTKTVKGAGSQTEYRLRMEATRVVQPHSGCNYFKQLSAQQTWTAV